ncbi:hypothetical protein AYO44_17220 [Planctomycetaceae bacterium SCGC AG-212-F19]|nr:hypothetical protein AYO44_17220 [Planctomycetaceae bacterium SCGC AG-212-F19]
MPILPAEPGLYPATLFTEPGALSGSSRSWRVFHTKPRQEKALARELHDTELPFYLPLIARPRLVRGRRLTAYVPLFPGYCFALADETERIRALATHRVVRSIEVPDQAKLWADLRQIQQLIDSGAPITPEGQLGPGTLVEIRTGPLAGLRGVIISRANQQRFVVRVDFIQRGASVDLDQYMLAKVI